jgi:predicted transcriptional regulator
MLKEILKLIHDTGVINTSEIAETIGISQPMVEQAIAMLQSKNYLGQIKSPQPNPSCANCVSCHNKCEISQSSTSAFFVTEKGKQYLNISASSFESGKSAEYPSGNSQS